MLKPLLAVAIAGVFATASTTTLAATPKLNDKQYFSQPSLDVVVFSNWYNGLFGDSKMSGTRDVVGFQFCPCELFGVGRVQQCAFARCPTYVAKAQNRPYLEKLK